MVWAVDIISPVLRPCTDHQWEKTLECKGDSLVHSLRTRRFTCLTCTQQLFCPSKGASCFTGSKIRCPDNSTNAFGCACVAQTFTYPIIGREIDCWKHINQQEYVLPGCSDVYNIHVVLISSLLYARLISSCFGRLLSTDIDICA